VLVSVPKRFLTEQATEAHNLICFVDLCKRIAKISLTGLFPPGA